MDSIVFGVDPGLGGGVAAMNTGGEIVEMWQMPVIDGKRRCVDPVGLAEIFRSIDVGSISLVMVEQVHGMPGEGTSSLFSFGRGFGIIEGVVATIGLPYEFCTPQAWMKVVLAGSTPEDRKQKKAAIAYVARRWPNAQVCPGRRRKPHDGLCDALCLAEFARRSIVGTKGAA